jgi:hypothetical protein
MSEDALTTLVEIILLANSIDDICFWSDEGRGVSVRFSAFDQYLKKTPQNMQAIYSNQAEGAKMTLKNMTAGFQDRINNPGQFKYKSQGLTDKLLELKEKTKMRKEKITGIEDR